MSNSINWVVANLLFSGVFSFSKSENCVVTGKIVLENVGKKENKRKSIECILRIPRISIFKRYFINCEPTWSQLAQMSVEIKNNMRGVWIGHWPWILLLQASSFLVFWLILFAWPLNETFSIESHSNGASQWIFCKARKKSGAQLTIALKNLVVDSGEVINEFYLAMWRTFSRMKEKISAQTNSLNWIIAGPRAVCGERLHAQSQGHSLRRSGLIRLAKNWRLQ